MTRLLFVRHGPTHATGMVGWRDLPADLSDQAAIARLSAYLPVEAVVISSDLIRARDTATAVAADLHRLPDSPDLREFNFGDWDGLDFNTIAERDPSLSRQFWENPGDVAPPNGDSWHGLSARVSARVDRLIADHPDRPLVIVAHFGVILTQLARALGTSPIDTLAHRIDPLSVTETHILPDGTWTAGTINHKP